jgi:hypothetical protein
MIAFARFSDIKHVNDRFLQEIMVMGPNPYDPGSYGSQTIADVLDHIRRQLGERAARSLKITVH